MREYIINKKEKEVVFEFRFDRKVISELKKASDQARWDPKEKVWRVPVDNDSAKRIIKLIKKHHFHDKNRKVEELKYDLVVPDSQKNDLKKACDKQGFTYEPRDYQIESLYYANEKESFINGDDVGLGKTFEAILYAETTNSFPCLVMVPSSVKYNWAEKWIEITDKKRSVAVIESKQTKKRKNDWEADVVIINYDIIGKKAGKGAVVKFEELNRDWKMVIADEAHFLKSNKSVRAKAAKKICDPIDKVQLLTGTVVMNKPIELWNLLQLIKKDHLIADGWTDFVIKYCGGYNGDNGWYKSGATNIFELNNKLRKNCYIRREKTDVLKEIPPVTKQIIETPISNKEEYKRASKDLIEYLREEFSDEKADSAAEAEALVSLGVMRQLSIKGKINFIKQYLKDWREAGNGKLVIFGIHKEPLQELSKMFDSSLIAGGVKAQRKQQIIKEFQENEDDFLFLNIASGGTGIDGLQNVCNNALVIELPWRPSDLVQLIGRLVRSGQKNAVTVSFLLSSMTIDQEMWEMLEEKERVTDAVNRGKDVFSSKSSLKNVIKKILKKAKE